MSRNMEDYIKNIYGSFRQRNKEDAQKFDKYLQNIDRGESIGLDLSTRYNYAKALRTLEPQSKDFKDMTKEEQRTIKALRKDYKDMTKPELQEWAKVLEVKYAPGTVEQHKSNVKRFFQWLYYGEDAEKDDYPQVVKWIRTGSLNSRRKRLPKRILSKADVKNMVGVADNQRDRALMFTLYEAGTRAGEHMGLKLKDITFDEHGAVLRVDGKTGPRRMRVRDSIPDLRLWLNMHPRGNDPNAALWVGLGHPNKGVAGISKAHLVYIVKRYANLALNDNDISPHTFRHSRATHLANILTEAQMKEFFGWEKDSKTPAIYTHLSGRDVDKTLLKAYGVDVEERLGEKEADILKPVVCMRCRSENPVGSKFCNCGLILDERVALRLEQRREEADTLMAAFVDVLTDGQVKAKAREAKLPERLYAEDKPSLTAEEFPESMRMLARRYMELTGSYSED